ncbi:MAG: DNA mismatch repair endonuclease MutL [Paludibacter sp.]|nr:DNA mismatch repair endonuclease MutL [Paludibacter sp.]MDD4198031.1 DNA mismatch repair endonuclease MutL [Paludibacter sp.]MDD4427006.1 DNA mismatch repair endonuclease MutL [Paludibacter sp.]
MHDVIHLLPDSVANQIAAGEVIQRPASVLKELVENAIDAGATFIRVVIKDAGRTLVQVSDNGKGMSETDARMAFERHATSKIKDAQDLFSIRTMGFRGEALASIAAVAQVEVRSRREEDELGTLVEIAGSRVFKQEPVQCDKGTSFQVKNLFFNVPARRRFLKSDNVEKNHLLNEFYRIVLVHPDVEFSFYDAENEVFNLPVSNTKLRIEQVFGTAKKKLHQQLLSIETETNLVNIKGFIGRPEYAQKQAHQFFFVNGRYMRHSYFHKAVMLAYNQLIQPSDNPSYFIYFEVDPQTIDINIHPTKTEIKFENEQAIWSILSATVKEALGKFNVVPSIDFDREGVPDIPVQNSDTVVLPPKTSFNPAYNPFGTSAYKRPRMEWEELYKGFEKQETSSVVNGQAQVVEIFQSKLNGENEHTGVYFQLKNKYIITSVKSGMLMIDQRRAHIRILFDQFIKEIQDKKGFSQQLLFPELLQLMPDDYLFFEQIKAELRYVGFDFEADKAYQYQIKGIPVQLKTSSEILPLLSDMLERVKSSTGDALSVIHEHIALSLAETAAIQSGQTMSKEEMTDLVDQLFACPSHHHTPDGRLIMSIWTQEEIQNRFN